MKLIMPMAGEGSRFNEQIKPLVDVGGVPMFVHAERCIGIDFEQRIFIVRAEHNMAPVIEEYYPGATVIEIDETTQGTACTILLAREHWQDESAIFIANCDQHIEWDGQMDWQNSSGCIFTFFCDTGDTKWSYARCDDDSQVLEVAEKVAISEDATAGWYYWDNGMNFESSAYRMIAADDRVNGEFYTAPVYNYYLKEEEEGIQIYDVERMMGIGTPDDLTEYLLSLEELD